MKELSPLEKAIEYIEDHLHEDIGLSDVSKAAGYSYYHMTRLFSCVLGESVGKYMNRRRLYEASKKLIYTNDRIIDVALESGFETPEAFSRAFKLMFHCSPTSYRKVGLDQVTLAKRKILPDDVCHIANNISHTPKICWIDEIRIMGIRGTTMLSDNKIPQLWAQFLSIYDKSFTPKRAGYEICETLQTTYTKDGDVSFSVMIGVSEENLYHVPEMFIEKKIAGGKYAVFTHQGTFANLFQSYQYIYGTWLASTKEELDDREDFQVYEHEVIAFGDPKNIVKIFIPIK
ncbi:AraC family transcriptional regulator [Beduini massiliensis]|uniref:AraC family transcriptional regulator n=1 Tax=Beduini massiliensis TaxID=1585974 RepID=UPI00059A8613|nr:AraC family transcriptional regulator [Beduini massiliensis]